MASVVQKWVSNIPMMQQTVLLTAIRGPDGVEKYSPIKYLLRWYRRCILLSAMDGKILDNPYDYNGGSFTGPSFASTRASIDNTWNDEDWERCMDKIVDGYLRQLDSIPLHFHGHFRQGTEILGYKHPNPRIRGWWQSVYLKFVKDCHLLPESEEQLDHRLGDDRAQWLQHNNAATVD